MMFWDYVDRYKEKYHNMQVAKVEPELNETIYSILNRLEYGKTKYYFDTLKDEEIDRFKLIEALETLYGLDIIEAYTIKKTKLSGNLKVMFELADYEAKERTWEGLYA